MDPKKSAASKKAAATRRANKAAAENHANYNRKNWFTTWGWIVLLVLVCAVATYFLATNADKLGSSASVIPAATEAPAATEVVTEASATEAPTVALTEPPVVVTEAPAIVTTEVPATTEYPAETSPRQNNTIPGMNITSWLGTDDSGMLPTGMTAIGDVKVEGKIFYDSGSGEATIVVNTSSREVKIYGEWGASLVASIDKAALAAEVWNSGCDQNNGGCTRIRFVEVTDKGTTQYFINRPPSQ